MSQKKWDPSPFIQTLAKPLTEKNFSTMNVYLSAYAALLRKRSRFGQDRVEELLHDVVWKALRDRLGNEAPPEPGDAEEGVWKLSDERGLFITLDPRDLARQAWDGTAREFRSTLGDELIEEIEKFLPPSRLGGGDETRGKRTKPAAPVLVAATASGPEPAEDGAKLFADINARLHEYYYMEHAWQYNLATLFSLQGVLAPALPLVFYLLLQGTYGSGKTNLFNILRRITNGVVFANASLAALARLMTGYPTTFFDEAGEGLGKEQAELQARFLRQGYKADATYDRYNIDSKEVERLPMYGAKALAFRKTLRDEALASRGYFIIAARLRGQKSFDVQRRNFFPHVDDLAERVARWSRQTLATWTPELVEKMMHSTEYEAKVRRTVPEVEYEGTRETELAMVAVLVSMMVGVDLTDSIRAASKARTRSLTEGEWVDAQHLLQIVVERARIIIESRKVHDFDPPGYVDPDEKAGLVRIQQKQVKEALDFTRVRERSLRPLTDAKFAEMRRDLGVQEIWISHPGHATVWMLPSDFVVELEKRLEAKTEDSTPDLAPLAPTAPSTDMNGLGSQGATMAPQPDVGSQLGSPAPQALHIVQGGQGSLGRLGGVDGIDDPDPEDLFPSGTRTDRLRKQSKDDDEEPDDPEEVS